MDIRGKTKKKQKQMKKIQSAIIPSPHLKKKKTVPCVWDGQTIHGSQKIKKEKLVETKKKRLAGLINVIDLYNIIIDTSFIRYT